MGSDIDLSEESDTDWQIVKSSNKRRLTHSPQLFKNKRQHIRPAEATTASSNVSISKTTKGPLDSSAHTSATKRNLRNVEMPNNNNKYAALQCDDDDNEIENETNKVDKPPPIFIPGVENIKGMINSFSKIVSLDDFYYKSMKDGQVRIMVKTVECFRTLVHYLDQRNISFHTYQLKQHRAYRVVLKKLHFSTPVEEIKSCLEKLGHKVRNITNIKSRHTKQPMAMFYVDLEPQHNNKDIYKMRDINNAIISVEPPRKTNDLLQCHRCQDFGHSKSYCRKPPRCVKCGLDHLTVECKKLPEDPPRCALCSETHPANYKGCIVYQKHLKRKIPNFNHYNTQHTYNAHTNNEKYDYNTHIPGPRKDFPSYAQVLTSNEPSTSAFSKIEFLLNKQIELTNNLLTMMSTLLAKLCN